MSKKKTLTFGELIRELRETLGLPLTKIGTELNIDPSLLGKIERNERRPTKEQIKKFAQIYNQDENYLFSEYLSDEIAYRILDGYSDLKVLKIAERKVHYLKSKKNVKNTYQKK